MNLLKKMGIIRSKLTRPIKTYNVDNRAQKVINQEKPKAAPWHPSVHEQVKIANEINPDFIKEHYKRDEDLYDRLKKVFVTSHVLGVVETDKTRRLPEVRSSQNPFEYGFWEPDESPEGRALLRSILKFMSDHLTQPEIHTSESISKQYKLDPVDVDNVLKYYRVLQVVKIQEKNDDSIRITRVGIKGEIEAK